jgi:hypothetical protein
LSKTIPPKLKSCSDYTHLTKYLPENKIKRRKIQVLRELFCRGALSERNGAVLRSANGLLAYYFVGFGTLTAQWSE